MKKEMVSTICGAIGGAIASLFGGWSATMTTLLIFMIIDYISGLVVAGVFKKSEKTENGALESKAGFKGLCKKGMMFLFVVMIGFIANELISITENAGLMGIPLPGVITKAIEILNDKSKTE